MTHINILISNGLDERGQSLLRQEPGVGAVNNIHLDTAKRHNVTIINVQFS